MRRVIKPFISESLAFSDELSLSGAPTKTAIPLECAVPPLPYISSTGRENETYFQDLPDISIIDICKNAFNKMNANCSEAETNSGT